MLLYRVYYLFFFQEYFISKCIYCDDYIASIIDYKMWPSYLSQGDDESFLFAVQFSYTCIIKIKSNLNYFALLFISKNRQSSHILIFKISITSLFFFNFNKIIKMYHCLPWQNEFLFLSLLTMFLFAKCYRLQLTMYQRFWIH